MALHPIFRKYLEPLTPQPILDLWTKYKGNNLTKKWRKNPIDPSPPHRLKQRVIEEHKRKFGHSLFIETGTYLGDMINAQKSRFKKVISIELGDQLYKNAVEKFRKNKNITLYQGDSGEVLGEIMNNISEPAIFWLDGHYSGGITAKGEKECPILKELDAIFETNSLDHVLLIDDANCFVGENDYPTLEELKVYIQNKDSRYKFEVKDNIIRSYIPSV